MFTASLLILVSGVLFAQEDTAARLRAVKRVCIEKLGDSSHGGEAREMAFSALFASKRFSVTENCEKADAILKGTAAERAGQRARSEGDSTTVRRGAGSAAAGIAGAAAISDSERLFSTEMQRHATVALRLVDKEGDVLWAYTADSSGGKAKGALADAVERAVQRLLKEASQPAPAPPQAAAGAVQPKSQDRRTENKPPASQ